MALKRRNRVSLADRIFGENVISELRWSEILSTERERRKQGAGAAVKSRSATSIPIKDPSKTGVLIPDVRVRSLSSPGVSIRSAPTRVLPKKAAPPSGDVAKAETQVISYGKSRKPSTASRPDSWEDYKKKPSSELRTDLGWGRRLSRFIKQRLGSRKTPEWQRKVMSRPWGFAGTPEYGAPEAWHGGVEKEKQLTQLPSRRPLLSKTAKPGTAEYARHGATSLSMALRKPMHVCKSDGKHYTSLRPCPPDHKHVDTIKAVKKFNEAVGVPSERVVGRVKTSTPTGMKHLTRLQRGQRVFRLTGRPVPPAGHIPPREWEEIKKVHGEPGKVSTVQSTSGVSLPRGGDIRGGGHYSPEVLKAVKAGVEREQNLRKNVRQGSPQTPSTQQAQTQRSLTTQRGSQESPFRTFKRPWQ